MLIFDNARLFLPFSKKLKVITYVDDNFFLFSEIINIVPNLCLY